MLLRFFHTKIRDTYQHLAAMADDNKVRVCQYPARRRLMLQFRASRKSGGWPAGFRQTTLASRQNMAKYRITGGS